MSVGRELMIVSKTASIQSAPIHATVILDLLLIPIEEIVVVRQSRKEE